MGRLYIKQKVFSIGERFTVKDENQVDKYFIQGSFLSIPKRFEIKDTSGNHIATITKKVLSLLPKFFIEVDGEEILTIAKEFSFFKDRYRIDSAEIQIKGDWWDKHFEIFRQGNKIAHVNEKWFTWGDTFEVDVHDEDYEHIVIAIVVAIDCVKSSEKSAADSN
ncbi:LURP-one-related family protein [Amphibacillus sp. MSJ-3]|uniref:LURP-one-related/scramblase family protein n=1 Tax=Amphibacillus sp. MSJ-3 TaxID=2841505 RepID=UPI001C0EA304|nr:LURP-one-related family protein [Amphibacillus sp. MSJ-3]MBU5595243.1 LURP-one-related family protein [Amphibacillus sp. MSJ-3]